MKKIFLLDDLRVFGVDVTARTATQGYKVLETEKFDEYLFDHDLGSIQPGTSGYDVLKWALENNKLSDHCTVFLVTSNPVGRQNMGNILQDYNFTFKGGTKYVR